MKDGGWPAREDSQTGQKGVEPRPPREQNGKASRDLVPMQESSTPGRHRPSMPPPNPATAAGFRVADTPGHPAAVERSKIPLGISSEVHRSDIVACFPFQEPAAHPM